jgi:hypothetical protein
MGAKEEEGRTQVRLVSRVLHLVRRDEGTKACERRVQAFLHLRLRHLTDAIPAESGNLSACDVLGFDEELRRGDNCNAIPVVKHEIDQAVPLSLSLWNATIVIGMAKNGLHATP